jgi:hypothetical protein
MRAGRMTCAIGGLDPAAASMCGERCRRRAARPGLARSTQIWTSGRHVRQRQVRLRHAAHGRLIVSPQAAYITTNGKQVINFCANNYLGLSSPSARDRGRARRDWDRAPRFDLDAMTDGAGARRPQPTMMG